MRVQGVTGVGIPMRAPRGELEGTVMRSGLDSTKQMRASEGAPPHTEPRRSPEEWSSRGLVCGDGNRLVGVTVRSRRKSCDPETPKMLTELKGTSNSVK
jgi:hypothetical protein